MFSVTREVSLDFQWVTASPLFSALPQQGLGWGRVLQEVSPANLSLPVVSAQAMCMGVWVVCALKQGSVQKNLAKDMSACNGKPCKRCGVILDEECYMEWQWAPLYMGPASLPILGIISAFSLVLFYIGIILMFCICAVIPLPRQLTPLFPCRLRQLTSLSFSAGLHDQLINGNDSALLQLHVPAILAFAIPNRSKNLGMDSMREVPRL